MDIFTTREILGKWDKIKKKLYHWAIYWENESEYIKKSSTYFMLKFNILSVHFTWFFYQEKTKNTDYFRFKTLL